MVGYQVRVRTELGQTSVWIFGRSSEWPGGPGSNPGNPILLFSSLPLFLTIVKYKYHRLFIESENQMINKGDKVPAVNLIGTDTKLIDLSKAVKGKPAVIAFFPGAFTSVCTAEMCHFRDDMAVFNSLKARVYGISVDSPFSNKEFKEKNQLNFEILSDYSKEAIKSFGVEMEDFLKVPGFTVAKRAVFISDSGGIIKFKWVSENPGIQPDYNAIQEALKSAK